VICPSSLLAEKRTGEVSAARLTVAHLLIRLGVSRDDLDSSSFAVPAYPRAIGANRVRSYCECKRSIFDEEDAGPEQIDLRAVRVAPVVAS
jgi:hypothetical protein